MFEENNEESIRKMEEMFETEKYRIITNKVINNDTIFIDYILNATVLHPKTLELLDKAIKYHLINEDYELCAPLNGLKLQIINRQQDASNKMISF